MHNDFDAVGEEEEVVTCFCRNLDLEENLLLRKDKLHNYRYILLYIKMIMLIRFFFHVALTWISSVVWRCGGRGGRRLCGT